MPDGRVRIYALSGTEDPRSCHTLDGAHLHQAHLPFAWYFGKCAGVRLMTIIRPIFQEIAPTWTKHFVFSSPHRLHRSPP